MRRALTSGFLALLFAFGAVTTDRAQQPAPPPPPQDQAPSNEKQPSIVTTVNLVDVLFTVLNRRNKLVPDLEKNDFKISDDKTPQAIRYFSKQTDLPLRIGLLLDTSNSIRDPSAMSMPFPSTALKRSPSARTRSCMVLMVKSCMRNPFFTSSQ